MSSTRQNTIRSLDLGCGKGKAKRAIGVDIKENANADIIYDLNKFPYPFRDNIFDEIYCYDILEHLDNVINALKEIYRISKSGAKTYITVPHFTSDSFYAGLEHKRAFSIRSFNEFEEGYHPNIKFRVVEKKIIFRKSKYLFWNYFVEHLVNKIPIIYENSFLRSLFPAKNVYYALEKVK